MKLVIAEKPSVARSIAEVLEASKRGEGYVEGNGWIVSWCVGHLVGLAKPESYEERYKRWAYADLPIFPEKWKYEVTEATKKQFQTLKKLMGRRDVESLVCATDAGREGELIFRLVYQQAGCRKPFERLWISSMEDSAIREGFENLKPGAEYDALYQAALCRERADWLVGMNATRLFSTLYGQTLNIGRVMTPTLSMAVMRERAIAEFKPESFYTVQLALDDFTASSEKFQRREDAETIQKSCISATVVKITQAEKTEKPPALYDLTSLQREANRLLGYTAQQTLDYTQSLYEKKLVTYPRTDSRYLTEDMAEGLPELVNMVAHICKEDAGDVVPVHSELVINNKKVTDHHAIIPTREVQRYKLEGLPKGEQAVLRLISQRLCMAVGELYRYAETVMELEAGGTKFTARGKSELEKGWRIYEEKAERNEKKQELPALTQGDKLSIKGVDIKEGKTTPPKHYTEDTLLSAMETAGKEEMSEDTERKGLGTPATRASVIEKLVRIGFLERQGSGKTKYLIPTHKGTALVTVMPEQIQSPAMTADWEAKLLQIERGAYKANEFMGEIQDMISGLVQTYQVIEGADIMAQKKYDSIGKCPVCGSPVENRNKGYFCSSRNCKFALWKENRYFASIGQKLTDEVARELLRTGEMQMLGCRSAKTGRSFNAKLLMKTDESGYASFSLEFIKRAKGGKCK